VRAAGAAMRRHLREVLKILDELRARVPGYFLPGGDGDHPAGRVPPVAVARTGRRRAPIRNGYRFGIPS